MDLFLRIGQAMSSAVYICLDADLSVRTIEDSTARNYATICLDNGIRMDIPGVSAEELAVTIEKLWEKNRARHPGSRGRFLERIYPGGGTTP